MSEPLGFQIVMGCRDSRLLRMNRDVRGSKMGGAAHISAKLENIGLVGGHPNGGHGMLRG